MRRFLFLLLSTLAVAVLLGGSNAHAQALRQNAGFNSRFVPRNDDGSSGLEAIGFTINFFGKSRASVYVNNNGNLTFDSPLPTFTPFGLQRTEREIIAPFFADVDTRNEGSRVVTFGQDTVNGKKAFGANYVDVGYYSNHVDKLNSFQVVLIDRSDTGEGNFDIEFNYLQIRWETGDASGGTNGYGGTPAAVGWSNGSAESFELLGSLVSGAFLDGGPRALVRQRLSGSTVPSSPSAGTAGRVVFRARDGIIGPGLRITNGVVLPEATLGVTYSNLFRAVGSDGPYKWTLSPDVNMPPGLSFNANTGALTGTPTAPGSYSFTLSVTANTEDGEVTIYERGSVTVRPPNVAIQTSCPLADATAGRPYSVSLRAAGAPGSYTWTVEDPYSMPPGMGLSPTGQFAGTPWVAGTYIMNFRARSNSSAEAQVAGTLCRLNVKASALQLATGCHLRATSGVPYNLALSADGGVGPHRFDLIGQLPFGLALTQRGSIAGTTSVPGIFPFQVAVTDSQGAQSVESCVMVVGEESFSVASACPLPTAVTGYEYAASLPEGYTWSISSGTLPAGLRMAPDGAITGTPMTAGPARFGLIAADSIGNQAGVACSLSVARGPLSISGCPLPTAGSGEQYTATLNALGGSGPYFFTVAGTLPPGIELSTNGVLSGRSTAGGLHNFTILVRESSGQTVSQSCSLNVNHTAVRIASACPLPDARLGEAYAARLEAAGGAAPYRFDFNGYLPDGLQVAADGSIRGTPYVLGGRTFLVRVTDSVGQAATSVCSVNVAAPKAPLVRLAPIPSTVPAAASNVAIAIELEEPYSQQVEGEVVLEIQPETRSTEPTGNQADPRLMFGNGQTRAHFYIPAGRTRTTVPLLSTGTVASTVYVSVANLKVYGTSVSQYPSARIFRVVPSIPSVTSACYTRTPSGIDLHMSGLSTTRELRRIDVQAGPNALYSELVGTSAGYYSSAETVRFGGLFSLYVPFEVSLPFDAPLPPVSYILSNSAGETPSTQIQLCR